jgi:hypothetical protein
VSLAAVGGVVIAVPATLVLAGMSGNADGGPVSSQAASWSGKQSTRSKKWKPVPGVQDPASTPDFQTFTFSAEMARGAVKVRVVRESDGDVTRPGPVRFSSKGSNSFTFAMRDTCGLPGTENRVLEWKRVGKAKAVAAKLATHAVWDSPCV